MFRIINKIYFYFYCIFVRRFYEKIGENNKDELYCRHSNLAIFVKEEGVGKQIYDVVKSLKDQGKRIQARKLIFKISKYFANKQNKVELFCINVKFLESSTDFSKSKIDELMGLVRFVRDMEMKGYILDESRFDLEKCTSISDFLSLFVLDDGQIKSSKGCLVKYIHKVLSDGGNLEEYYKKIVDNNLICKLSEFPYTFPVVKMCYNYYVTGNVEEDIYDVLREAERWQYASSYKNTIIANKSSFDSNLKLIENNKEYAIYDGNMKIYHYMSPEFEQFLKEELKIIINSSYVVEQIDTMIIDYSGKIIGYKFSIREIREPKKICDMTFEGPCDIIDFIAQVEEYLFEIKNCFSDNEIKSEDFSIYDSIISYWSAGERLILSNFKQLFDLATMDREKLDHSIINLFFDLYKKYLESKYGEMHGQEQFLEKMEVRYLSPLLAKMFFEPGESESIRVEFYKFLNGTRCSINGDFVYDSRFEYIPLQTPFIFDYEAEKKFGIKIEKGMQHVLPDGRILRIFSRVTTISKVKAKEDSLKAEIAKKLGDIEDSNVRIVGISEIICSKDIGSDDMYKVIGYISKPIKGNQLTLDTLMNLSNRDFLKVAGYLFSKFAKHYITFDHIWMDDDFTFYINIWEKFEIVRCQGSESKGVFLKKVVDYLIENGCDSNKFVDINFPKGLYSRDCLLDLADSMDAYCDEHQVFYNSAKKACPICLRTKYMVSKDTVKKAAFEDMYARHYKVDSRYNLKVYNASCVDMQQLEENIDKIISNRLNSKDLNMGQECFIPYKKALGENKQFIGYIYDRVQFDEIEENITVCSDVKDPEDMKNLPRLKSVIRLMLQIKEVTKSGLGFTNNPFSHVFLSKTHKKQVQILNIDFLSEKGSVEDTLKWTCEYVCDVITSDTSIEIDLSDCLTDFESILERLQNLAKDMTKYCSIHNMYYKKSYLFCPCCIDKAMMENIEVDYVEKTQITKQTMLNEGGEAFIYPYEDGLVAKVFREEVDYSFKCKVIAHVFGKKLVLEEINDKKLKYKLIIPRKLLVDKETNEIFGYVMNKVNDGTPLSSLRDKAAVEALGFTKKDVFEILITVGKGIEALHANNIYIGDLNGRNILIDAQKNVYFLDFDGMGIDDITPEYCTDGYIDPVSKKNKNITMKDDWYSFAVQAFYYLTFTHPFNGIYSIKENGKKLVLDITDKMERRISLLGNHGMNPPAIAESWDWMSKKLKTAFLEIFEGENRESIIPYLVRQYEKLYSGNKPYKKSIRINPKFVATEINPFGKDLVRIINQYAAVCKDEGEYYVSILANNGEQKSLTDIDFPECENINNILLTDDERIAFAVYDNQVSAVDIKTNTQIRTMCNVNSIVVNGSTLYANGSAFGENVIYQMEFMSNDEVKDGKIKFLTQQENKRIYVKFNSKFIIVKSGSDGADEIYCNSEKLCDIACKLKNAKYNIICDEVINWWLVVNSEGNAVIINASNGTFKQLNIEEGIDDVNIENISFNKGMIYIPVQDYLYIINTNDQMTTKKMECNIIMTPNSKLYDINANGFSVITDQMLYEVRRG